MHFRVSTQVGQPNTKVVNKTKGINKGPVIKQLELGLSRSIWICGYISLTLPYAGSRWGHIL